MKENKVPFGKKNIFKHSEFQDLKPNHHNCLSRYSATYPLAPCRSCRSGAGGPGRARRGPSISRKWPNARKWMQAPATTQPPSFESRTLSLGYLLIGRNHLFFLHILQIFQKFRSPEFYRETF